MDEAEKEKFFEDCDEKLLPVKWGLLQKIVCAPGHWDQQKVEDETTKMDPPGTSYGRWECGDEEEDKVVDCNDCEGRKHWLLNC